MDAYRVAASKMDLVARKSGYRYYQGEYLESFLMAAVDTALAAQNAALAAESLGLGACWIQVRERKHEEHELASEYVSKVLDIPGDVEVESIIAAGYPDEATFLAKTEGSAIRRIGYERWLRNLAVGLGNAPPEAATVAALRARADHPDPMVREHVAWALARQTRRPGEP